MQITLPWFAKELHAHNTGHWRSKASAVKSHREMAFLVAKSLRAKPILGKAKIRYFFFVPDKRQRDEANMVQSCKPYCDGIVDSGLIDGDDWTRLTIAGVNVEVDVKNPRVVIEIEAV